jgi:hypothetical protein
LAPVISTRLCGNRFSGCTRTAPRRVVVATNAVRHGRT